MIKYLGSKRVLVPVIGDIAAASGAASALDLFTGTTRVAQELKRRGLFVMACDLASYSKVLADCYVTTDATTVDRQQLAEVLGDLAALPGRRGYFTETFCERSRYFQPKNGARVDAIREAIERDHRGSPLRPLLLTALMLAADRVDSTTGVQMAYLKQWAPRSYQDLELRVPELLPGAGAAILGDAAELVDRLPPVDLAYLDPPYNQHRYFTNYHIWETLVRWDAPAHYGIACKRADAREEHTRSVFNSRREMPEAFRSLIHRVRAGLVVVSYNDESWVPAEDIVQALVEAGHEAVRVLTFDHKRYVGAQIGIHNPRGERVGQVGRLRNREHLFLAGPAETVARAAAAVDRPAGPSGRPPAGAGRSAPIVEQCPCGSCPARPPPRF